MIDLVWNFPLLANQGNDWQQHLAQAVASLHPTDADQLRPTFRGPDADLRPRAAAFLNSDPARTWISVGGHHGTLIALLAAGLTGKAIAVEQITYTGILEQAKMLGCTLVGIAYDDEGMLPEALRSACSSGKISAIFTMPTVHNPLGIVTGLERRQAIAAVARDHNLTIIEDDAYGFMEPAAPPSYAILAPERTFYVRGMSKSYAPATRTGFVIVPEQCTSVMENVLKNTTTGASLPHNMATLNLIEDGTLDRIMQAKRTEGAARNAMARTILGKACTPGSQFAWHVWVNLPEGLTAAQVQQICFDHGVMVSGASGFTAPGVEPPAALRIGMGGEVERSKVEQGLGIVAGILGGD